MNKSIANWINDIWYKEYFLGVWFAPIGALFIDAVRFRRYLYRIGLLRKTTVSVPVIIIGNITVGGTGKTPLVIWMAHLLKKNGYHPGIISRGYGGEAENWPQQVDTSSDAQQVGDEAIMMAEKAQCPVVVGPKRAKSAQLLIDNNDCDVILSDDGLQHYALARDIEIIVIDGQRRFGNSYFLPAGPLREPTSRLQEVDLVICNGEAYEDNEYSMQVQGDQAINLVTGEQRKLSGFSGEVCHAIAGIGNPQRFFDLLEQAQVKIKAHRFPDHYQFAAEEIAFKDGKTVLMTEKDAVKCKAFATEKHWYIPVEAKPEEKFTEQLLALLAQKKTEK